MNHPLQFLPDFSHQNDTSEVLTINPNSPLGPFGLVSEFSFHRMQSVQKLASCYSAKNLDSKPWYTLDGCLQYILDLILADSAFTCNP